MALVQSGDLWVFLEGGGVQETWGNLDTRGGVWTGDNRLGGKQCGDGWNPNHVVGESWGQEEKRRRQRSNHVVGLTEAAGLGRAGRVKGRGVTGEGEGLEGG